MNVGQLVERQLSVNRRSVARRGHGYPARAVVPRQLLHSFMARLTVQVFWPPPAGRDLDARKRQSWKETVPECLVHVANGIQLLTNRASIDALLVCLQRRRRRIAGAQSLERGLRREQPRPHREMNALEAH